MNNAITITNLKKTYPNFKMDNISLNIKEGTPAIFYSNIMFYDNFNKTLPVGMNLSSEVLIDVDKLDTRFVKEESFYINYKIDEFEYGTKQVQVYEYGME